jgi:flagellar biosynthesis protein FlhA
MEADVVMGQRSEFMLAVSFFSILALLVMPVPPLALDVLLSLSITVALLILLLSIYSERPLDFSVFPSVLLLVTMLRLGLNVASTRLILLRGAEGPGAAGNVINAFGDFSVGGNTAVGLIVFLIFVVINFVVITKGAGRIAEVAARFTLDAMPGKQMAIDADLNQGTIDDAEALRRRKEIQREADFYGAMDGSSKFVRGDAIAGLLIMMVNILGGLFVGVVQNGMELSEALHTYTVLTIGDGLVSQVPALIVSTSAGIIVTRAAAAAPLADELRDQMFLHPRALGVAGGMLVALSLAPGLPFVPFALFGGGALALARALSGREPPGDTTEEPAPAPVVQEEDELREALTLDDLELEIGYGLIPLVDRERGGDLLNRIRAVRKQLAAELGFIVPLVHIRDNLQLEPSNYAILVRGNSVAKGEVPAGRLLALRAGDDAPSVPGIEVRDPAFGLPAVWIQERDRERATTMGYAVVDASTSVATHLAEVIRASASELLGHHELRQLLDQMAERSPRLVEDTVPAIVPLATLHHTLRSLLAERVSIRDLGAIIETLAEHAPKQPDSDALTDLVRVRLARALVQPYVEADGSLHVLTLDRALEEKLRSSLQRSEGGSLLALDALTLGSLFKAIETALVEAQSSGHRRGPVVLCAAPIRSPLRQLVARSAPQLAVVSYGELPPDAKIIGDAVVSLPDAH